MMSIDPVSHCHLSHGTQCSIVLVCISLPSVPLSQCHTIQLNPVSHYLIVTVSHCPSVVSLCLNVPVSHCIYCQCDISQSPSAHYWPVLPVPILLPVWPVPCAVLACALGGLSLSGQCACVWLPPLGQWACLRLGRHPHTGAVGSWGGGHGRAGSSGQRQGARLAREGASQGGGSPLASLHHLQVAGQGGGQGAGQE